MSFEIECSNLWTYQGANATERLPLSRLSERGGHIHGRLRLMVDGRALPSLGYGGPEDVCLNAWAFELTRALESVKASNSYTYDEGEQGQPAFLFEREGETVLLSVVASQLTGEGGNRKWRRVPVPLAAFEREGEQFLRHLRREIEATPSPYGKRWWTQVVERKG